MKRLCALALLPLLAGCVNTTLNDTSEFEEYAIRPASEKESKKLETCLSAVLHREKALLTEKKTYIYRASQLGIDDKCQGIQLNIHKKPDGYEAIAQFHTDETTVRWSMNQNGQVTEAGETNVSDDLSF